MEKWPKNSLEAVPNCPVCRSNSRSLLHSDLTDITFLVAPGAWTLHQCNSCMSAYLDPRPDGDSIHLAYKTYYTHTPPAGHTLLTQMSRFQLARRALVNGYCNWRFGTQAKPSCVLGIPAALLTPHQRRLLDYRFRFLPKPTPASQLLDIGCGNGAFLEIAKQAGWHVEGLETDPSAVATGRQRGLHVTEGDIHLYESLENQYDAITIHHVLEHVHDPSTLLKTAYRLLRSGGFLYIETPNIQSYGHKVFGRCWRGLEPPRHLVLFSRSALERTLREIGYRCLEWKWIPEACDFTFSASKQIAAASNALASSGFQYRDSSRLAKVIERFWPTSTEFLTIICKK